MCEQYKTYKFIYKYIYRVFMFKLLIVTAKFYIFISHKKVFDQG